MTSETKKVIYKKEIKEIDFFDAIVKQTRLVHLMQ